MPSSRFVRVSVGASCALAVTTSAFAWALLPPVWPDGNVEMHLQLGTPATPLTDGAADWNAVAESVCNEWNAQLNRVRFTVTRDAAQMRSGNGINNVSFSTTIYGEAWDDGVLAVTLTTTTPRDKGPPSDSDVIFNAKLTWDSYRGQLKQNGTIDFRRVALHEFGHVLGLDHPDSPEEAFTGTRTRQSSSAIMRSRISNTETLQPDDIAGVRLLYDRVPTVGQAEIRALDASAAFTLTAPATGGASNTYFYYFRAAGSSVIEELPFASDASYTIGSVQLADTGTYFVTATSSSGLFASTTYTLAVNPTATSSDTTLGNLSTRGMVGTGNSVLIAGFVIAGTTPKPVLVRAVGPALRDFGVAGALDDPTLSIVNAQNQTVAQSDNWETGGNAAAITSASSRLGAFQFKTGSLDSAVLVTLPPGSYSAVVSGVNNATGVALAEVYDADPDAATSRTHRLVNIATRGQVGGGENDLIAGLVVSGSGPRTYLIRAVGPTLLAAPFSVTGALVDPVLQVYRGTTLMHGNDDIDSPFPQLGTLRDAAKQVGAFALQEARRSNGGLDSAMILTLQPGAYTAKVSGLDGLKGVALIEIYEMP